MSPPERPPSRHPDHVPAARTGDAALRARLQAGDASPETLDSLLVRVSRTFALNIAVLPRPLRDQVRTAYLLCRIADTIEDDADLPPPDKQFLLPRFGELVGLAADGAEAETSLRARIPAGWATHPQWDRQLAWHCGGTLRSHASFPEAVRAAIGKWVGEMCLGMAKFSARQQPGQITSYVRTPAELEEYCYYVAGTVGRMLCDLFCLHSRHIPSATALKLRELAVSFGLGLQLTNILKDLTADAGRSALFLPVSLLEAQGLTPDNLHTVKAAPRLRTVSDHLVREAARHLQDAITYTCHLPRREARLRLFCLWPVFLAIDTLLLVAKQQHRTAEDAPKITRRQVRSVVRSTTLVCLSNLLIHRLFAARLVRLETILGGRPERNTSP